MNLTKSKSEPGESSKENSHSPSVPSQIINPFTNSPFSQTMPSKQNNPLLFLQPEEELKESESVCTEEDYGEETTPEGGRTAPTDR